MNATYQIKYSLFSIFVVFALAVPPSVYAQKIIKTSIEPSTIFRVGIGGHQLWGNSPVGGNITFNCEDRVNKHLSWTANVMAMMNPIDLALPPDTRSSYQTRLAIQPDFRYYTSEVFQRFYIGCGLGIVAGHQKTIGIAPYGKPQLRIFGEALTDLKLGWQGLILNHYVWNAFTATGWLLPLNGDKAVPIVRIGLQLGMYK